MEFSALHRKKSLKSQIFKTIQIQNAVIGELISFSYSFFISVQMAE